MDRFEFRSVLAAYLDGMHCRLSGCEIGTRAVDDVYQRVHMVTFYEPGGALVTVNAPLEDYLETFDDLTARVVARRIAVWLAKKEQSA